MTVDTTIQILTYTGKEQQYQGEGVKVNRLHDAESLDSFAINIILLQSEDMWTYQENSKNSIDISPDFCSVSQMLDNSKKAKNIILLPQNVKFRYYYISHTLGYVKSGYQKCCELKNMLSELKTILKKLYKPLGVLHMCYENTWTTLNDIKIASSFYFQEQLYNGESVGILTQSEKSEKPTTIEVGKVILSTLLLDDYDKIILFLKSIGLLKHKQERPIWMEEISMFDDDKQIEIIRNNQTKIQEAEANITEARKVIDQNNKYKSVLYTNGEELVEIVLKILEKMLGCDFSNFKDVKKEDFLTTVGEYTFIGEIKGVSHNVKSENVAQLDRHYQSYLDDNPDADIDKVCALLIMNYQKNKPVQDREPVHEQQIALAKRNRSLIIDTYTLLKLFEKYLLGEKSRKECIDILQNNIGLLSI